MEISKGHTSRGLALRVKGRLDAYWAEHLTTSLADIVREGTDHITLNLSEVAYLSSAGIRVLIQAHKQLKNIQGTLVVEDPSEQVTTVLRMAGLDTLLLTRPVTEEPESSHLSSLRVERGPICLEIFQESPHGTLTCQVIGNPDQLAGCQFQASDNHAISFPNPTFGVGLGAIGEGFTECRERFGEFLVTAGAAAYLPTDGRNVPDYSLAQGTFVPTLQVLYGMVCSGAFSHMVRFEPTTTPAPTTLTELVTACLDIVEEDTIGLVMVAESSGLLGTSLKRSPAQGEKIGAPFTHPEIRDWLSFTPERTHARGMTITVGLATRTPRDLLAPFLRPMGPPNALLGHFHAATFSYHPLQRGKIDLQATITTFFDSERLDNVLHLLNDHRAISGIGESEFLRGACWVGPITEIVKSEG